MTTAAVFSRKLVINDMARYSADTMSWCTAESEKASAQVAHILDHLLADATRMNAMSTTTLHALESLKTQIDALTEENPEAGHAAMVKQLSKFCTESKEMETLVMPIIEALQFQDRIRQIMENLGKMMSVWKEDREGLNSQATITDADWLNFAQRLAKCTTMPDERNFISHAIPQLPEEKKIDDVLLF